MWNFKLAKVRFQLYVRTVAGLQRITWLLVLGWARGIYTNTGHLIFIVLHSIIITTL